MHDTFVQVHFQCSVHVGVDKQHSYAFPGKGDTVNLPEILEAVDSGSWCVACMANHTAALMHASPHASPIVDSGPELDAAGLVSCTMHEWWRNCLRSAAGVSLWQEGVLPPLQDVNNPRQARMMLAGIIAES